MSNLDNMMLFTNIELLTCNLSCNMTIFENTIEIIIFILTRSKIKQRNSEYHCVIYGGWLYKSHIIVTSHNKLKVHTQSLFGLQKKKNENILTIRLKDERVVMRSLAKNLQKHLNNLNICF